MKIPRRILGLIVGGSVLGTALVLAIYYGVTSAKHEENLDEFERYGETQRGEWVQ